MQSAQIPVNFAPEAKNVLNARKLIVRAGAVARYDEAIAYLREELKSGKFERIKADEFAHVFNITSSFLFLVVNIGAVEVTRKKGGNHYRALPRLTTLTGQELRDHRLSDFPNPPYTPEPAPVLPQQLAEKTPEQRNVFVNAMNGFDRMTSTETGVIREPGLLQHELHGERPTYLVGSFDPAGGTVMKLQTCANAQFHDLVTAKTCMEQYPVNVGHKIVIVQVIEVVQSAVNLQPAIL